MDSPNLFFFFTLSKIVRNKYKSKDLIKNYIIASVDKLLCPKICSKSTVIEVFPKLPTKYAWNGQKHPMKKCFKMSEPDEVKPNPVNKISSQTMDVINKF